jgi:hypothetical protein
VTRQTDRAQLRLVGEFASVQLLKGLPRRMRRLLGRVYANASYRKLNDLDHALYGGSDHGYNEYQPNRMMVDWVAREGAKLVKPIEALPDPLEVQHGNDLQV